MWQNSDHKKIICIICEGGGMVTRLTVIILDANIHSLCRLYEINIIVHQLTDYDTEDLENSYNYY